uniref:Bromodomain-containing protein 4 n=1 Tax=Anthurium amnicola TaxID=1678845 RepID=A0A1D1ZD23_9ARAE
MKRKRGSKTGYKKGKKKVVIAVNEPTPSPSHVNLDEDLGLDDAEDRQVNSKNDMGLPSVSPDKRSNPGNPDPVVTNETPMGKSGYGRVKVKLKSSRLLGPPNTYVDAQTSETEKSNVQVVSPMPDSLMEKKEASSYSDGQTSDLQPAVSGKSPRKAGSIKIISSRGLGSSSVAMPEKHVYKTSSPLQMVVEREPGLPDNEKAAESSVRRKLHQREAESPYVDPRYNENELNAALAVIKKVMKMDAAEPFNAPVDPIALGIPDYFDVIETPMDFGTIRKDLEHGRKYLNSEDVYKDVQFIWENCYKYNNKGDYILDLMKRVKRNFMKYWMVAGLYSDIPGPIESTQIDDVTQSGKQKLYLKLKGKSSKQKRKRHGIDLHKSGCLCAVCVVRRRRKEREGTSLMADRQTCDDNLPQEFKHEKSSPGENIFSEHTSSSLDHSPEPDVTGEAEPPEEHDEVSVTPGQPDIGPPVKQELCESEGPQTMSGNGRTFRHLLVEDEAHLSGQPFEGQEVVTDLMELDIQKGVIEFEKQEGPVQLLLEAEKRQMESPKGNAHISVYEDPLHQENDAILQICNTLFSNDPQSVWRGPHSLNQRPVSVRRNPIGAALSLFMKR